MPIAPATTAPARPLPAEYRESVDTVCQRLRELAVQAALQPAPAPPEAADSDPIAQLLLDTDSDLGLSSSTLFLELEQTNRALTSHTKHLRDINSERRKAMDDTYLALQNLNYERTHYRREIAKCDALETVFQDVAMRSVDELAELAGDDLRARAAAAVAQADAHRLMLCRLEFELAERKRLAAILAKHKEDRNARERRNKALAKELEAMDADISGLLEATLPLQEKYGITITRQRANIDKAQYLPPPLFVLYKHVVGYIESNEATAEHHRISVDVAGEASAVEIKPRSSGVVSDETGHESHHAQGEATLESLYELHPLSLVVTIPDVASLTFKFATALGLVVVDTALATPIEHIPPTFLACGLLPGDDGQTSPNQAHQFLLQGRFVFDHARAGGFAFQWAQALAGLNYPLSSELNTSESRLWLLSESGRPVRPVLKHILEQLAARHAALQQTSAVLSELAVAGVQLPKPKTAAQHLPAHKIILKVLPPEPERVGMDAIVDIKNVRFLVDATLPAAYPDMRCTFKITKEGRIGARPEEPRMPSHIEAIESSLNEIPLHVLLSHFAPSSPTHLVVYMLVKLVCALEMYIDAPSVDAPMPDYAGILGSTSTD
ncbi:THO complex subunit 5 [Polyrhizophydium stewartii]|uniref:THO complex subunit 5 n=1 Tax=Polyrhizophydium stewartii TaxID=2732419 RepID=A0ABR4N0A0_9FUNG|nr:THO complex subunit 5 [Polyrhizophydium stewartii]